MANKVVVTGFNMLNALGLDWEESWKNITGGKSGVKRISLFDASQNQTQIAAELPAGFSEKAEEIIKKRISKQMTRVTQMCYVCAIEAVEKHGINFENIDKKRVGVIIGVVNTGDSSTEQGTDSKNLIIKRMNNAMSAWIGMRYNIEGPNFTTSSACSSSAYAIALGFDMIKAGRADMMIVGGADSILNKEEIEGFNELYALSLANDKPEKASCPFSKNRDGFVIGEGAGIMILESEEHAKARNAKIYAEMANYAFLNESYNIMAPKPDGEGMAETMELALKNAGLAPNEIDYINAHGTSTMLNDMYETKAIKKVFGEYAYKVPISSTKSMIGHTIGAAGAIESIITILSIKDGIIPPTINLDEPDPELDLDYVPHNARKQDVKVAISNSFAFGGHNAALVFKKY
ncbi:MAG: 3-oxoacyl-ACP synthase [Bacteroidetes bacterium GWC2_33_15]|nr:MAG: 3-oxoacyl-ACP synthase [Bacteroidetes bacterium GWA2_33_15]OFX48760.1 MAG: 3-oxoacyl-ACP synthase [Bacteroidetes bacterium GWC2_33_15]OFX66002.1 MAG: 3-oxoacyl-ACP synthase [Bacteroidetes bacterium GWB2_32_14]OFX68237.1 MAG: 3-oxoacyl-ACP synthase [Bacteroidetes bacterium GWD2_33_33]HAN18015.1 beta-ketoacyl-[acyl-carrier-protein] synthase family protein [Bacteroidales bacterium]